MSGQPRSHLPLHAAELAVLALLVGSCGRTEPMTSPIVEGAPRSPRAAPPDEGPNASAAPSAAGTEGARVPLAATTAFSEGALEALVTALASDAMAGREEDTPGGIAARQLILDELVRCGVPPAVGPAPSGPHRAGRSSYEQPITTGRGSNVLARIEGTDPQQRARVLLVGAHFDHIGRCGGGICNGANDNAAAVAILLQVACALVDDPPEKSVLFAFWDAEEPPTFLTDAMGSEFYAANPLAPLDTLDVAIALDLVGGALWPGQASHFVLGSESSPEVRRAVEGVIAPAGLEVLMGGLHLVEETPFGLQPWSDYHPFRERGVPVLFFSNGQNKNYHEVSDEVGALDLPKMALEARYLHDVLQALGSSRERPVFDGAARDAARDAATVKKILEAALGEDGLIETLGLSEASRRTLADDLIRVIAVEAKLGRGGGANRDDLAALRRGAQRVMCLAGSDYSEFLCRRL